MKDERSSGRNKPHSTAARRVALSICSTTALSDRRAQNNRSTVLYPTEFVATWSGGIEKIPFGENENGMSDPSVLTELRCELFTSGKLPSGSWHECLLYRPRPGSRTN